MKALVTGGAGFIGSHLVDRLIREDWEVLVVDDLSSGYRANVNPKAYFSTSDISMGKDLQYQLERRVFRPDIIFHLAGQSSLQRSLEHPQQDLRINAIGTLKVIEVAQRAGCGIVFSSTSAVYAPQDLRKAFGETYLPYHEQSPVGPTSPYGVSKLSAELYLRSQIEVPFIILRYGNVFGPRQWPIGDNQVVPRCLSHFFNGTRFTLYGEATLRDYIYVTDVVDANMRAMMVLSKGLLSGSIYNIGKGRGTTTADICSTIAQACGQPADYTFDKAPARSGELPSVALLSTAARSELLWEPSITTWDGIEKTTAWWRAGCDPQVV